ALVAAPAHAAARQRHFLAGPHEVVTAPVPALYLRPRRHEHHERVTVGAVAQGALPVPTAVGPIMAAATEGLQVAQRVVAAQHDVATAAAVAAVRPALGHVGLAPERQRPVAAAPGPDLDVRTIRKHFGRLR